MGTPRLIFGLRPLIVHVPIAVAVLSYSSRWGASGVIGGVLVLMNMALCVAFVTRPNGRYVSRFLVRFVWAWCGAVVGGMVFMVCAPIDREPPLWAVMFAINCGWMLGLAAARSAEQSLELSVNEQAATLRNHVRSGPVMTASQPSTGIPISSLHDGEAKVTGAQPTPDSAVERQHVEAMVRYEWSEIWAALSFLPVALLIAFALVLLVWPILVIIPLIFMVYKWWCRKLSAVTHWTMRLGELTIS